MFKIKHIHRRRNINIINSSAVIALKLEIGDILFELFKVLIVCLICHKLCIKHAAAYLRTPEKSGIAERESGAGLVCCRRNALVRTYGKRRHLTPAENREHQANTFAAFIAMPRQTFVPLARELIRKEGFPDGILSYTPDDWECDYALENVCNALSEAYGVSYTAAQVHLRELDLVLNYHIYEERKENMYYPG